MSRKQKLLQKIRENPRGVSFEDLDKLLRWAGFLPRPQRSGTSHYVYTKPGTPAVLTIPRRNPLKAPYVMKALKLIEEFGDLED